MKNTTRTFLLLLFFMVGSFALMGSHYNINGVTTAESPLFNNQSIGASSTVTSAADTSIGRSENQSVQYRVTSAGGHDVALKLLTSLDEIHWARPDTGGTITAHITDSTWHHAIVSIPVSRRVELEATTLNSTPATIIAIFGAQ